MPPMRRAVFVCLAVWVAVLSSTAGHPLASPEVAQPQSPAPAPPTVAATNPEAQPAADHTALLQHYCITCPTEPLKTVAKQTTQNALTFYQLD